MLSDWEDNRGPGRNYRGVYGFGHLRADCPRIAISFESIAGIPYARIEYGTTFTHAERNSKTRIATSLQTKLHVCNKILPTQKLTGPVRPSLSPK